jgi:integrase
MFYFGRWDDPDGALKKYLEQKDDLHAGRTPRPAAEELTIKDVANAYLNHKQALVDAGELKARTWREYKDSCARMIDAFGKRRLVSDLRPDDFALLRADLAKSVGPVRLGNEIQRARSVFKFAFDAGLIGTPVRFGPGFARPSKKTIRLHRAAQGPRMFEAEEIRRMLDAAGTPLKAMLLLAVNGGFGNADCATLPLSAVNLETGWVNYARPKTGIARRFPLWPETVGAMREALARRPDPKSEEHAGLFFVTRFGGSWHKGGEAIDNPVSKETRKLLDSLGINGQRNFYGLRHSFETIAGESADQVAVDHIMGHARDDMASVYRERISDERLRAVAERVRLWLYADKETR